ncbi:unnamed protein product [Lathyrus sativus]|nr:unnamed protein product [Lathyrus sativus]CAK8065250.1 unnamed protein product [Lathyrus sativus]
MQIFHVLIFDKVLKKKASYLCEREAKDTKSQTAKIFHILPAGFCLCLFYCFILFRHKNLYLIFYVCCKKRLFRPTQGDYLQLKMMHTLWRSS